jgi:hypothetical protein
MVHLSALCVKHVSLLTVMLMRGRFSKLEGDKSLWALTFKWTPKKNESTSTHVAAAAAASAAEVPDDFLDDAEAMAAAAEVRDKISPLKKKESFEEKESYGPIVEFLKKIGQVAYIVADGENLSNKLLYHHAIYTIRAKDPSVHGQNVTYLRKLKGRTDLVILTDDFPVIDGHSTILRSQVKVLIEIKTPETMSLTGSLHEAMLQLIGANVANDLRSPPVVISNLRQTHYVLYLSKESTIARPHYYLINKVPCASFGAAITFALERVDDPTNACSADFCRGPTREPSPNTSPPGSPH